VASLTTLTNKVKRSLDLVGVSSRVTTADIVAQINASMAQIARRVKLQALQASTLFYTNTTSFTSFTAAGGSTTVEADLAIDLNPTAGCTTKVIHIKITGSTTFSYSLDGGSTWSANVTITGNSQVIYKTTRVTFANTTGYTADDLWVFTAYADLPDDYDYGLIRLRRTESDGEISVLASFNELQLRHPQLDEIGTPDECAIGERKQLFVQPCPSASEALRGYYQAKPTEMPGTDPSTEEPDGLPESYQLGLLCDMAAYDFFEDLGQSEQAARRLGKVQQGIQDLMVEEGVLDSIDEEVRDEGMYT
jgi:hypothetical protein